MTASVAHHYIDRASGLVRAERLLGDGLIRRLYSGAWEKPAVWHRLLISSFLSRFLAWLAFDFPGRTACGMHRLTAGLGLDWNECLEGPEVLDTPRKVFERKIRYWETRPMPANPRAVVSPADCRVLILSLDPEARFFIKEKFFTLDELLGGRSCWLEAFRGGDAVICRLTPEKYHYNHTPVAGRVLDIYEIGGGYLPCNPSAVLAATRPYSRNKRVVTVLDTDVEGGTGVGRVAMIEVVALMIGGIVQCYSAGRYDEPGPVSPGMFLEKGAPKSLFRPGSSTDVLLFEPGRVAFDHDLMVHQCRPDVPSRFSRVFESAWVETDVPVRSPLGQGREK